jgi:hypothetical protein
MIEGNGLIANLVNQQDRKGRMQIKGMILARQTVPINSTGFHVACSLGSRAGKSSGWNDYCAQGNRCLPFYSYIVSQIFVKMRDRLNGLVEVKEPEFFVR